MAPWSVLGAFYVINSIYKIIRIKVPNDQEWLNRKIQANKKYPVMEQKPKTAK